MSNCVQKKRLSADKISSIFEGLSRLMPSNRPSTREVLESQQAVILAAIARGNSLRDIVNYLSKKGLNLSHETLRKIVGQWQQADVMHVNSAAAKAVQNHEPATAVNRTIEPKIVVGPVNSLPTVSHKDADSVTKKEATKREKFEKAKFEVEPDKEAY